MFLPGLTNSFCRSDREKQLPVCACVCVVCDVCMHVCMCVCVCGMCICTCFVFVVVNCVLCSIVGAVLFFLFI